RLPQARSLCLGLGFLFSLFSFLFSFLFSPISVTSALSFVFFFVFSSTSFISSTSFTSFPLPHHLPPHHRLLHLRIQYLLRRHFRNIRRQYQKIRVLPHLQLPFLPFFKLRVRRPARIPAYAILQRYLFLWLPASRRPPLRRFPRHARIQSPQRIDRLHGIVRPKRQPRP